MTASDTRGPRGPYLPGWSFTNGPVVSPELPEGFVKRALSDSLTPLTLHGADSHFARLVQWGAEYEAAQARQRIIDSPTGRTTRPKPALQRLPWNEPKRVTPAGFLSPEPIIEAHGMYECKLAPVFDDIPATHEIVDPKPREWSGPDEPPRVSFRVSAATVLSLGGGS